jgi:peptidoglycan hydrolase-like protein with peptidoglycan-binding domain
MVLFHRTRLLSARVGEITLVLILCASAVQGAVQRMGISKGIYEIAAGSARNVAAFCFDFTRESPSPGVTFSQVLASPDKVNVRLGSELVSLQTAINDGKIEIRGLQLTFGEYLKRLSDPQVLSRAPEEEREKLKEVITKWNALSPEQRERFEQAVAPEFAGAGDYTQLQIVNHTSEPVSLEVQDNTIVGEKNDTVSGLPVSLLSEQDGQAQVQDKIWEVTTKRYQALLKDAGFLRTTPDGLVGEQTKAAIEAFQKAHGLEPTGQIDDTTEVKLISAADNQTTLRRINRVQRKNFLTCIVNPVDVGSNQRSYRISFGSGKAANVDSLDDLRHLLLKRANATGTARVYVIPDGFSSQESEGLSFSLTNKQRFKPLKVNIQVAELGGTKIKDDSFFGERVTKVVSDASRPQKVRIGSRTFLQKEVLLETGESGQVKLTVIGKTKRLISQFIRKLHAVVARFHGNRSTSSALNGTPLSVVNVALAEMQRELNLSARELRTRLQVEMGSIQLVEARPRRDLVALDK